MGPFITAASLELHIGFEGLVIGLQEYKDLLCTGIFYLVFFGIFID